MSARLVIAAPRSGEGKTSVTLGLAAALRARGLTVGLAKVGPDYLDTGWLTLAAGRPARNLDVWTMGEEGVRAAFSCAAKDADVVLIEGVMGLFDGHRTGAAATSTADVAKLLDAPVVLVVDSSRAGGSVAALAHGFATLEPDLRVAAVVLNRFGAHRERASIVKAFERTGLSVLGWLPDDSRGALGARHLGLVEATEDEVAGRATIDALGEWVERHANVDALLALARSAEPSQKVEPAIREHVVASGVRPRIAVARDEAFSFTYVDNLEILEACGAEIVEFSPLHDAALPCQTSGLYLGGGYPELHAEHLAANESMRASVAVAAAAGMPVYAECGGMLYLLESLTDADGVSHAMTGVVSARGRMGDRVRRVGYVEAELASDCVLGAAGIRVRGHEFRYSTCEPTCGEAPAWLVDGEGQGFATGPDGAAPRNVIASYLHLNFAGCPEVAGAFVEACAAHAVSGSGGFDE